MLRRHAVPCVLGLVLLSGAFLLRAAEQDTPARAFPVRVELDEQGGGLRALQELHMDVDAVFGTWARVYVDRAQLSKLRALGFPVTLLPDRAREMAEEARKHRWDPAKGAVPSTYYHTYATLTAELQMVAAEHPEITQLISIGQSVQGRELWMLKISNNPDRDEDEPEFAYISSMHGDEVVGKELCINLIHHLTDNYGTDGRVSYLVDNTEIWIMPSMNPDGTELGQRRNANNIDLNRDFPDFFFDPENTLAGREPETQAVMVWSAQNNITLKANLHGGALVVNYPFDNNETGASVFSPTPDQDTFVTISRTYADNNPPMSISNDHPAWDNGITNGADWYAVSGGMQDWAYVWNGTMEVLIELSRVKWPPGGELPQFWDENSESMVAYMEHTHRGVRGVVTDAQIGEPVAARVYVDDNPFPALTDTDVGDYHRILEPGTYDLTIAALGYRPEQLHDVFVGPGAATRYDVALQPQPVNLQPLAAEIIGGTNDDPYLDPGESANIAVTLGNFGMTATDVRGHLLSTGWFSETGRRDTSYPDIEPGQSGESLSPHHPISVSADAPPGHRVGLALAWESDQGAGVSEPLFVPLGVPTCTTAEALDVPRPIGDLQTVNSSLTLEPDAEIAWIHVSVDIEHSYIGDLRIELGAPSGRLVVLHDRSGAATGAIQGTYGVDLVPSQPLSALVGEGSAGTWTLRILDLAAGDDGQLNAWSVEICGRPFEETPPEMRIREVTRDADGVVLSWWPYPGLTSYRVYRSTDPSSLDKFDDVSDSEGDSHDTRFIDESSEPLLFYLVTGVGPRGEGPLGHFGE